jgi:hypothetical protein
MRNAIPRPRLIDKRPGVKNRVAYLCRASHAPSGLHVQISESLNWEYMWSVAYQCRILVVLEVIRLDTLFLCNNDKHDLGQ